MFHSRARVRSPCLERVSRHGQLQAECEVVGPLNTWRWTRWQCGRGSLRDDELVRHGPALLSRVRIPGEFRIVDAVEFPGALDRRDAVPPGLRSDGVGGSPAELGGEVRRWIVFKGGEPGGVAGREFLAGDLGSMKLRGVVLVPPDTGVLLLLELRASSVERGQAGAEPLQVAGWDVALAGCGVACW
jgi:hypothetical protein